MMIPVASAAHSTAYVVGEFLGIAVLAVLSIGLGLRALDLPGGRAARTPSLPPAPGPALDGSSVAPPGWTQSAPAAAPPRRPAGRSRRARRTDAAAALVFGVLLVAALVRIADHHTNGPWDTPQGRMLHAGFTAGCQRSSSAVVVCGCIWDHLTSTPPYDTPAGFVTLASAMNVAIREQNVRALPPQVSEALASCRRVQTG
jgi:hypothetical protein